jgi:hypothetical protein
MQALEREAAALSMVRAGEDARRSELKSRGAAPQAAPEDYLPPMAFTRAERRDL